jgi:hypothetical protein
MGKLHGPVSLLQNNKSTLTNQRNDKHVTAFVVDQPLQIKQEFLNTSKFII